MAEEEQRVGGQDVENEAGQVRTLADRKTSLAELEELESHEEIGDVWFRGCVMSRLCVGKQVHHTPCSGDVWR